MENKCHHCTERYVGCHAKCQDYADFKARLQVAKEKERKEKFIEDVHIKSIMRAQSRRKRK